MLLNAFDLDGQSYRRRDVLESDEGYSPLLRTLGVAAVGGAALAAHRQALQNSETYAARMHRWALRFEDLTPNHIGSTFRFSERTSSYVVDDLHFRRSSLFHNGDLTEQGQHFQRIFGDAFDLEAHLKSRAGQDGIRFKRSQRGSPFLDLEGAEGVRVRFSNAGRHYTGSSARYNRPLQDQPNWEWYRKPGNDNWKWARRPKSYEGHVWERFHAWREGQKINNSWGRGARAENGTRYAPWYAQVDGEAGIFGKVTAGYQNFKRAAGSQIFELFERPQHLLAEFGLGLKKGSYNKVFHVPFVGEGGLVNGLLTKRVLPIALGLTALRWADYKLGHRPSNAVINTGLRANVLRADLTDQTPGARSITDWYAENVPGPQYGPLALPAAGAFVGGLIHMGQVAFTDKFSGTDRYARLTREMKGSVTPNLNRLRRAASVEGYAGKAKALWGALGTPGKGAAVGLALMLPFIPGMIGSRKTGAELRRIYSGEEDVPVRQGRWWEVGSNAFGGGRITAWRKHASVLYKSRAQIKSLYGDEKTYWEHNPLLHPFKYLKDPYWLEKKHYEDRPYPVTSPAFSNVPLIGPLLAATVGKLVKPAVRMHEGEWDETDYTLYSNRLEPKGRDALAPAKPREEFGLWHTFKQEARTFAEFIGLPGFIAKSTFNALYPDQSKGKEVYLQGSRQMDSYARTYYERNLGAGMMLSPETENGLIGYSEPLRRFIQHEGFSPQVNEIANTMPDWMPGDDYLINFKKGDPYIKVDDGYARLPGAGYAALHPELEGVDPADYPDLEKMRILGDIAPYSRQYNKVRSVVEKAARGSADLRADYERIVDQVEQTKESTLQVDVRRFDAPVDTVEGTVEAASIGGFSIKEYPGRVFRFSSVGTKMADLVADQLGASNQMTRSEAAQGALSVMGDRDEYLSQVLAAGTKVSLTVSRGAIEGSEDIRAVVTADGQNINRELIDKGYATFRWDRGGSEEQAMHGTAARALGRYAEALSFEGDNSRWNPLRYLPGQVQTKLWQERTAYAQYLQQEAIGTRMRRWERPIHDFISPYVRGAVERVTNTAVIPDDVQRRRDLDTLTDQLQFIRSLKQASDDPANKGKYTSQGKRTAVGANLFGSAGYVASTLPTREARYFRKFVNETDPEVREKILGIVPDETRRALQTQWAATAERLAEAEGSKPTSIGSEGRLYDPESVEEWEESGSELGYGNYLRSLEIAKFFSRTGFALPDEDDSEVLDENVDYQDVKLRIVQQEGYDEHDFNLFDDRSSLLWRKPYIEGAVQELTSGDDRSTEQLRLSVEQMMLAAGMRNPDVRTVSSAAPKAKADVRVDVDVDEEEAVLNDMRRNPESYQS